MEILPKRTLNLIWGDLELILDMETIKLECVAGYSNDWNKNEISSYLVEYLNIRHKLIDPIPRKITYSEELKDKIDNQSIPSEIINYLKDIETKFEKGENVNGYLNKGSVQMSSQNPKPSRIQDPHYLLFGIKHLHISNEKENNGYFYKRSDYLLFIYHDGLNEIGKDSGEVFFVDVKKHSDIKGSDWVNTEIVEIFDRNFPEITNKYWMSDVTDISSELSDKDRMDLTNAGIVVFSKINNKVLLIDGVNGAGTSGNVTQYAFHILNTLTNYLEDFKRKMINIEDLKLELKGNALLLHNTKLNTKHFLCYWRKIDFLSS